MLSAGIYVLFTSDPIVLLVMVNAAVGIGLEASTPTTSMTPIIILYIININYISDHTRFYII